MKQLKQKSIVLIIVVFALVVSTVLAWTLGNFLSVDLETNSKYLGSERALGLAEAGGEWALKQLSGNFSCTAIPDSTHTLNFGEYTISNCTTLSPTQISFISTGYIPSTGYRLRRKVKYTIEQSFFGS